MSARKLAADEVALPRFAFAAASHPEIFDLTSHARAREALDFGLSISGVGFNIFVVAEDRSRRMTATHSYLDEALAKRPPQDDWVYLNDFRDPAHPMPQALPAGQGRRLRDRMRELVVRLGDALAAAVTAESHQARVQALRDAAQREVAAELASLKKVAESHSLALVQGEDGSLRLAQPAAAAATPAVDEAAERDIAAAMTRFQRRAVGARAQLADQIAALVRGVAAEVATPLFEEIIGAFAAFDGIALWLGEARDDVIATPGRFAPQAPETAPDPPQRRYDVNLFVDHGGESHPVIVLEGNPSYENLFGWIEYRQAQGSVETDFTMIRAGALHRANGGVLVLRAEGLAANPTSWAFLKAALRDCVIRIEEPHRAQMAPIAGAPKPVPVPLDLKIVIVGAPRWYAFFFDGDADFGTYFKIRADIDDDMEATPGNLGVYAGLILEMARAQGMEGVADAATGRLLGTAARWAERRDRLTARIEQIEDLVNEAVIHARAAGATQITDAVIVAAAAARRRRQSRIEDRLVDLIVQGALMIDTTGGAVGQVNALTVHETPDRPFGTPVRVTARASVGRAGIVNIERNVALGGPIQQKGAMVLQGFLAGRFAQRQPLSFTCSITFEQLYGGVEGDSASMAELIAVLSDLAKIPVRQEVAITGSVNQAGMAQAIGGTRWKIEGFYRVCAAKPGGLTGRQGVIIPEANRVNLVLHDEIAAAIAAGRFHLWSIATVEAAAEILLGVPAGAADADGNYPPDSIFGHAAAQLQSFDRILAARAIGADEQRG
ncbi:MAG TPA: AAA family ATPase [Stellaceae bacterium]|nr:AAA family ATPase [Stellaceae bacterium]